MVLKLYGPPASVATRRAAVIMKEKNIPYQLVDVDMPRQNKSTEFLQKQPFGQVPYIDDDGFILYESRAIGRYISAQYPSQGLSLVPKDVKANALFEQAAAVEIVHFDSAVFAYFFYKVLKTRITSVDVDLARSTQLLRVVHSKLDVYEVILSKYKYLAGDEVTLADLFHLPWGYRLIEIGDDVLHVPTRPNVARWWDEIFARPSWQAVKDGA